MLVPYFIVGGVLSQYILFIYLGYTAILGFASIPEICVLYIPIYRLYSFYDHRDTATCSPNPFLYQEVLSKY